MTFRKRGPPEQMTWKYRQDENAVLTPEGLKVQPNIEKLLAMDNCMSPQ